MSEQTDVIIERIRKILDRSKDPNAPEGEVLAALSAAKRLMDKYAIDEEAVLASSEEARKSAYDSVVDEKAYQRAGKIAQWDRTLALGICKLCDVGIYNSYDVDTNKRGNLSDVHILHFYGLPRDVTIAKFMYMELLATMRAMCRLRLGKNKRDERSYCSGFADSILSRALQIKQARDRAPLSTDESTANAIVLVKDAIIKRYAIEKLNLKFGKSRGSQAPVGAHAYGLGQSDGKSVQLNTNGIDGRPSAPAPRLLS